MRVEVEVGLKKARHREVGDLGAEPSNTIGNNNLC